MRISFMGFLFVISLTITSCSTKQRLFVGENGEQKAFNIPYGQHKRNIMDVWIPAKRIENSPLVMLIHGGAWKIGNKSHLYQIQNYLHDAGYCTVSINYRFASHGISYEDQVSDIGNAIDQYQKLKQEKIGLLPEKIVLLGESAGGHLALLYGYRNPNKISKIISLAGPADFMTDTYNNSSYHRYSHILINSIFGKNPKDVTQEDYIKASPISQVSKVPTLIFQGTKDPLVNVEQGKKLDKVLTEKNIPHRLILMEGKGHVPRLFLKKWRENEFFPTIINFLETQY